MLLPLPYLNLSNFPYFLWNKILLPLPYFVWPGQPCHFCPDCKAAHKKDDTTKKGRRGDVTAKKGRRATRTGFGSKCSIIFIFSIKWQHSVHKTNIIFYLRFLSWCVCSWMAVLLSVSLNSMTNPSLINCGQRATASAISVSSLLPKCFTFS